MNVRLSGKYIDEKQDKREKERERQKEREKIVNLAYLAEHRISILLIIGGLDFKILVRRLETRNFVLQV